MKIKKFYQFVKENYNMGRQDVISIILDMDMYDSYTYDQLNSMDDSDLDRIYNELSQDRIPSGSGGFVPRNKAGINYTGYGSRSDINYTG